MTRASKPARVLLLADESDVVAAAVARRLATHHPAAVVAWVRPQELARSGRVAHRLHRGRAETRIRTGAGGWLDESWPTSVLNRVEQVPATSFPGDRDQEYAAMETFAFTLSWLAGFPCRVINPATPRGLAGDPRTPIQWLHLAGHAGLPSRRIRWTTSARIRPPPAPGGATRWQALPVEAATTNPECPPAEPPLRGPIVFAEPVGPERRQAVVLGASVLGAPQGLTEGCRRLADATRCSLLAVDFGRSQRGWIVVHATPTPRTLPAGAVAELARLVAESP